MSLFDHKLPKSIILVRGSGRDMGHRNQILNKTQIERRTARECGGGSQKVVKRNELRISPYTIQTL